MVALENNTSADHNNEVDMVQIGENITKDKLVIQNICLRNNIMEINETGTFLLSQITESDAKLAGFEIYGYFKRQVLENNYNFQQVLGTNIIYKTYAALCVSSKSETFFEKLMSKKYTRSINNLCQQIVSKLYHILSECSCDTKKNKMFELKVLECMQNESVKSFDSIFIKHFYELYRNNDQNKCWRLVLVNVLKHIFIEK